MSMDLSRRAVLRSAFTTGLIGTTAPLLSGCGLFFGDDFSPATPDSVESSYITTLAPTDSIIEFHIAAGRLTKTDGHRICPALSGNGTGLDNPSSFIVPDHDPIPPGWYIIGPVTPGPTIKRDIMLLTPTYDPVTKIMTPSLGREQLCIHYLDPATATLQSEQGTNGCIAVSPAAMSELSRWRNANAIRLLHVLAY